MAKCENIVYHGAPRPDILSPWRQLLRLPIPCHVHWPRPYCQGRAHTAAVCRKPCFRDLPCMHKIVHHGAPRPIAMASTVKPPDSMPCALAATLL